MIENGFTEDQLVVIYNWLLAKEADGYTLSDVINEQFDRRPDSVALAD